ncbi:MAG: phage protein Gp27 family protein [Intestinimonas sp.]
MAANLTVNANKRIRGKILMLLYSVAPGPVEVRTITNSLLDAGSISVPDLARHVDYLAGKGYVTVIDEEDAEEAAAGPGPRGCVSEADAHRHRPGGGHHRGPGRRRLTMGEQRERQRIKSRVDEFPDEIRAQMDGMLADVNYTYQEIADTLTEQGYEISRSAVGRYAMRHNSAARRLKEAREQTTALLQQIRENQDVESTELASAILIDGLTRRIATAEEDFDALPLDKAGRLLVQLQRSTIYKERWRKERLAAIESVERNVKARMRQMVQDDPDLLERLQQLVSEAAAEEAGRDEG